MHAAMHVATHLRLAVADVEYHCAADLSCLVLFIQRHLVHERINLKPWGHGYRQPCDVTTNIRHTLHPIYDGSMQVGRRVGTIGTVFVRVP